MNALKRYSRTLLCSVGFLAAALVAGCGGGDQGRSPILGLGAADLVSVAVSPALDNVNIGASKQYVAVATYTDGSSRDVTAGAAWTSATPAVATVDAANGLAVGVNAGSAVIAAAFNGKSGNATLTVNPATLSSIIVLPANTSIAAGTTQQFVAMGTFSNNTTRDISALSTFASATPTVASIDGASGLALGLSAGTTVITATSGSISASTNLTVTVTPPVTLSSIALTPQAPSLQIGAALPLVVTATYSDNSTAVVTSASSYATATGANVAVTNSGVISGVSAGTSLITASYNGKTATTNATVFAATLTGIVVTPATASIPVTGAQQFVATATYSDSSTGNVTASAAWTSSNTLVATVLNTGVATGLSAGTANIIATVGAKSGNGVLTVTATAPLPSSASVDLRSAASFGVLAATSLTNNSGGTTFITGNVGSPSQTTDPVVAPGYTDYKSGAIMDGAFADLQKAITDANSRTCDVSSGAGIDLGGATLAPGVYCYAGSISITGTLTLNGPGVYIFRSATTLDTTANSIVQLLGGATAADVSWLPVGPTTLGANSVFKGSILAKSAAITVGDNTTLLNGRVLSGAAVTLKNNQIAK